MSFDPTVGPVRTSQECKLIFGNKDLGDFRRTFLRTAVAKFTKPDAVID